MYGNERLATPRRLPHAGPAPVLALLLLTLLLAASVLAAPSASAQEEEVSPDAAVIRIGIVGDQTFAPDVQAAYDVLQEGVTELSAHNLDVVLHVGDLVESGLPEPDVRALFFQGAGILDGLPVDWFLTAGDHDVNPPAFEQDSEDRSREALFQELYGARVPEFQDHPWYSFDRGQYHFIALYSHQVLHADPRFGNIFLARLYEDQIEWLRQDLEDNEDARAIVVFIHQPLWYHWSGWRAVHELLTQYPVAAVISGHFHYDQDNGVLDGIRYLTVGATGGLTKTGDRDAGDVDHVSILQVQEPGRTWLRLLPLDDDPTPLPLTPREDMDRVQALDVQLGNFFGFAGRNPVFVDDGELVSDCATGAPATVTVTELGNPIDLPLTVEIAFDGAGSVALDGPGFLPSQCTTILGPLTCELERTTRTFISNYSSVLINQFFAPPLWQTGLVVAGSPPAPGTILTFHFETRFQGDSGGLFLERDVTIPVQACP